MSMFKEPEPTPLVLAFFDKIGIKLPLWQINYVGY